MINFKLIVSDFDGTLLTSKYTVPKEVKNAISEYVAQGGIFAVCTGRMLKSILPRVRELGLKGLVVAYQGTVIAEIESGKIIKCGGLDSAQAVEVCKALEGLNATINAYSDEVLYSNIQRGDKYLDMYERITGVRAESVEEKMSEFVARRGGVYQKFTSLVPADRGVELYESLVSLLGKNYDVTRSADVLCEVSPLGDNKGAALKYIAEAYNIPMSSTVAVGDNLNDLSMIRAAAVGVAVGNAVKELKSEANYIAPTNDELAVKDVIYKFGFKND